MCTHIASLLTELCELARSSSLPFMRRPPAQEGAIATFRALYGNGVDGLANIFEFSNGLDMFGLTVCSLDDVFEYGDDLLAFQNWGNGDYDCVTIRGAPQLIGTVVFTNHQPAHRAMIAPSMRAWLRLIISEARSRHEVLHPRDYVDSGDIGTYAAVLRTLAAVDCELSNWLHHRGRR